MTKPKIKIKGSSINANRWLEARPKADLINEQFAFVATNGYKEKDKGLSFKNLKTISLQVAPISAIINTRINQVGLFTKPARYDEDGVGFKVVPKDRSKEVTARNQEDIQFLEDFIYRCGSTNDSSREDFDSFLRKVLRDSLVLDQLNFEIVRDENKKPIAIYPVDASTIRVAAQKDKEADYAQVVDGRIVAEFTSSELAFAIRNPRTDIDVHPYGYSEIESIVKQLSSYLEAEEYNMRFFKQGGMTKGILNIKSDPNGLGNQAALEDFKRQWRTQVTGQSGAWKIPVMQLPGELEFINVAQSGGEMVFEKWVNYLINISCAVYQIDPAEINFPNNGGVGGTGGGIFESSNDTRVKNSKNKGLYPLLQFVENTINRFIINEFSQDYMFKFTGLNEKSEAETIQVDKDKVSTYLTVNELRQEKGYEPIENGDIILNPYYLQAKQAGGGLDFEFSGDDDQEDVNKSILTIQELDHDY